MKAKPKIELGQMTDSAFFIDLAEVFDRYPDQARRYSVRSRRLETDVLNIDFTRQYGVSRVEGDRIVTTFHDRDGGQLASDHHGHCCESVYDGGRWVCVFECLK